MASDGLDGLRRQADAGNPAAAAFTAVLAGLGLGEAQDWALALQRLARAAGLGSAAAQGQLRALSGRTDEAWAEMAAGVDLEPWLQPAEIRPYGGHPRIAEAAGFLTPQVCAWLIGRASGRLKHAPVYDAASGALVKGTARNNSAFGFLMADLDLVILLVRARIAATLGTEVSSLENLQILHYAPGQSFEPHYDFLDPAVPGYALEMQRAGQRKTTFLVYLNDAYEGGATDFPLLGLSYRGRTGDALMFANLDRAGEPDRSMLHAGLPPTRGEKWVFSQWVRQRPEGPAGG
jgi:hypothetical protein